MSCRHFQYLRRLGYKSKAKSVLCKAPIRDIWHGGSVVVVAMRDQSSHINFFVRIPYGATVVHLGSHQGFDCCLFDARKTVFEMTLE